MQPVSLLSGKTVVIGVCGSIAAYKACELARLMLKDGAEVRVIMTDSATHLVAPRTFSSLTRHPVAVDPFTDPTPAHIEHVTLAVQADVVVIAPATANAMAKLATGICDDMLPTTVCATAAPLVIAPAMNPGMWANPATQRNARTLAEMGYFVVEPGEGEMACGDTGRGRLAELPVILAETERAVAPKPLAGRRVLVTTGATREPIAPLRYVSNRSTGLMGMAVAYEAWLAGAEVTLVAGALGVPPMHGPELVSVGTAAEMNAAVLDRIAGADVYVGAAAVADFTPATTADQKLKKSGRSELTLTLLPTRDILAGVCASPERPRMVVGFAAETERVEEGAQAKLESKGCDLIVANRVGPGGVMGAAETEALVLGRDGSRRRIAGPKRVAARELVAVLASSL